ncbi:hypothetical protein H4S08_004783 [Coemansia sp. RSA 1365]|nr:hypothetical protein H4S08_004783 [Coemansia sp. RSA 1365]
MDCGTVISLFAHKTTSDADPLAQFKLSLTELGMKKRMIIHRKSKDQQTADWLLQAKERLHPDKIPAVEMPSTLEETIGSDGIKYVNDSLSMSSSELSTGRWSYIVGYLTDYKSNDNNKAANNSPDDDSNSDDNDNSESNRKNKSSDQPTTAQ